MRPLRRVSCVRWSGVCGSDLVVDVLRVEVEVLGVGEEILFVGVLVDGVEDMVAISSNSCKF